MEQKKSSNSISVRSFLISTSIIIALWIGVYITTFFIPSGILDSTDKNNLTLTFVNADFTWWQFLLSPILIFTSADNALIIEILIFLLIIAGSMESLSKSGILKYAINKIAYLYSGKKYICMAIVILLFMLMGSFVGSFEEIVPFIPVMTLLAMSFGWDAFTGICISLVAASCGFSAGIMNPFTVGIAQTVNGIAMFSGIEIRIISFALIYALFLTFMLIYVKGYEKKHPVALTKKIEFSQNKLLDKGALAFLIIMGTAILIVVAGSISQIKVWQDLSIVFVALGFLLSSIICPYIIGTKGKDIFLNFIHGIVSMLPAIFMILIASSIKYILTMTKTLDTILYYMIDSTKGLSPAIILLIIYLIVLVMNFFIPSGSAKATLISPLIVSLAIANGINPNLAILAFAFGDGFSNVLYPTNPVLLIGLNLIDESYGSYFKKISPFQLVNLILTSGILVVAFLLGF